MTTTTKQPIYRDQIETDIQQHAYHRIYFALIDLKDRSFIADSEKGCFGYIYCPDNCAHMYIDTTGYLSDDPLKGQLLYQFADQIDKQISGTRDYDEFIYRVSKMLDDNPEHY